MERCCKELAEEFRKLILALGVRNKAQAEFMDYYDTILDKHNLYEGRVKRK